MMAMLTTVSGDEAAFDPDNVAVVTPNDEGGAAVYGISKGAVMITENPAAFIARLGIATKLAKLTRPDGSPVWIKGAAVSSLRAPLRDEYPPEAHAVIVTGPLTQAVRETP